MKRILLLAFLVISFTPSVAKAQGADVTLPEINSLKTPPSPAFTILGVSPTAVARPMTPSAVGLTILSNTNNLSELPRDFSMEVAPYWLFSHPRKTWQDDITRTVSESLLRTSSISMASAQSGVDSTSISLGVRASILSGRASEEYIRAMQGVEANLSPLADAIAEYFATNGRAPSEAEVTEMASKLVDDTLSEVEYKRVGWFLEAALASLWLFPQNTADMGQNKGWSGWLTLSYDWKTISLLGVARYQDNETISPNGIGDFGLRALLTGKKFGTSFEAVWRATEGETPTDRIAFLFEYELWKKTWVSLTLGQDFDSDKANSLIAQLGLNLNFDKARQVQMGQ